MIRCFLLGHFTVRFHVDETCPRCGLVGPATRLTSPAVTPPGGA